LSRWVLLAINKNFISDEVEELHPGNDCEIIWAKLDIKGSKTLYISPFSNPKTSDEKSLTNFDISVRRASQIQNAALFIGGDFNQKYPLPTLLAFKVPSVHFIFIREGFCIFYIWA
jgi:hypothetical protein